MPQKLSGGRVCGAIRYECDADPIITMNCHRRECQKASGSGYAAIVVVPKAAVRIAESSVAAKSLVSPARRLNVGFAQIAAAH
jgi:hypothetical protein